MDKPRVITPIGVVVIIVVVAFIALFAIGMAMRNRDGHPYGRTVCNANLRDLVIAWIIYADDNDGKLVNGRPGVRPDGKPDPADDRPTEGNRVEIPWARGIEIDRATGDPKISKRDQELLIKEGALWPNNQNVKAYRCPGGKANHARTYSIVCSLNGDNSPVSTLPKKSLLCVKNRALIRRPHNRIVFTDEGWVNNLGFRVEYDTKLWMDPPPVRHRGGMTFAFADGHCGYWKWEAKETVKAGKKRLTNFKPATPQGIQDLHKMQKAVWGKIPF